MRLKTMHTVRQDTDIMTCTLRDSATYLKVAISGGGGTVGERSQRKEFVPPKFLTSMVQLETSK